MRGVGKVGVWKGLVVGGEGKVGVWKGMAGVRKDMMVEEEGKVGVWVGMVVGDEGMVFWDEVVLKGMVVEAKWHGRALKVTTGYGGLSHHHLPTTSRPHRNLVLPGFLRPSARVALICLSWLNKQTHSRRPF